jgi:hypothetical protein
VVCFFLVTISAAADLHGTLRIKQPSMPEVAPEEYSAAPHGILTLCNLDRVYRVKANSQGQFTFTNIKAGTYSLVAGDLPGYAPEQVGSYALKGAEVVGPLTLLIHGGKHENACQVSTQGHDLLRDYDVDYKPEVGGSFFMEGHALRYVHHNGRTKPLARAEITLAGAGNKLPVKVTRSGKDGAFRFYPEKPGSYELTITRNGYHAIRVPPFLVVSM